VIDFALSRLGHRTTTKCLGVKSEELPVGVIESNLVVAPPVFPLDEAGTERQSQIGGTGPGHEFLQTYLDSCLVELVSITAQ